MSDKIQWIHVREEILGYLLSYLSLHSMEIPEMRTYTENEMQIAFTNPDDNVAAQTFLDGFYAGWRAAKRQ